MRRIPGRQPAPGRRRGRRGSGLTAVCCALGVGFFALTSPVSATAATAATAANIAGKAGTAGTADGAEVAESAESAEYTASSADSGAGRSGRTEAAEGGADKSRTSKDRADKSRTGKSRAEKPRKTKSAKGKAAKAEARPGRADLAVHWEAAGAEAGDGTAVARLGDGAAVAGAAGAEATDKAPGPHPDGPRPDGPEADFTYTYRVSVVNHGPSRAVDVVVTDRLPDSLVFVSSSDGCTAAGQTITCGPLATLAVGETHTWLLTVRPADDYTGDGSDITNVATVTSDTEDPDSENNTAVHTGVPVPGGTGKADLALTKTALLPRGRDTVAPGETFTYRVTVHNNGPSTAVDVRVVDPLPAVLAFVSSPDGCRLSDEDDRTVVCPAPARLPAGESVSYELVVRVRENATTRGGGGGGDHSGHSRCALENTAFVTSLTRDPVLANNSNRPGTTGPGGGPLYLEHPKPNEPHQPQEPNKPPHRPHHPSQLAHTGEDLPGWLPWSAGLTLATGGALVLLSRRHLRAPGLPGDPEEAARP
ncbi:DUF11 domain-containing protein [Streptomyces qinzhouensis]|uniref:DUF11 domain-containing protein n=1 Tax=Streptomyces qinzhouensis TaxID=2599401 RepID=A0A5B8IL85_9ACTN|nr:DUF11 domain-containing protein [Streptomyces qinzhouensis]QDY78239.1 DUF11 domain-containing protein [Streptomyces qinzhouensis]